MKASKLLIYCALLIAFAVSACQQKPASQPDNMPPAIPVSSQPSVEATPIPTAITSVNFDEVDYKFGEIAMGDKAVHRFIFKNTGQEPLVIENVKPSCNCTVPDWTREPVPPGGTGFVETSMEAKAVGIFKKSATVTLNADPKNVILNFSGEVVQ
jgi:Protein of unknown function (DUF1573)